MKILHIFDHSLPLHDGYSFRSLNILKEQRKLGWEPVSVTSPKHEQYFQTQCGNKESIEDFIFYRSGATRKLPGSFTSEVWLMHVLSRRILEVAKIEKPDIIHAHSPILNGIPALWAGRKLGLPVVYEIRAFWEDAAVDQGSCREGNMRYRLTRMAETMVCSRADQIAILCNGLKKDLVGRFIPENKITLVFNGVNVDDFKPVPPDREFLREWKIKGKKVVGFIGSFYRYEGLDLLVAAFAEVVKNHSDTVLLLVGGGEMEEELRQLIAELKLADKVIMPGRIPHERVPGVYAMINVLAYPRYSVRLTELVTPLKPLEAMAMGKALVASDVGGHKELIRHNETGLLFKAGDVHELAAALDALLNNTQRREQLQSQGQAWVHEHHTWEKTTSVYSKIYATAGCAV